jgi:hypothetical protein
MGTQALPRIPPTSLLNIQLFSSASKLRGPNLPNHLRIVAGTRSPRLRAAGVGIRGDAGTRAPLGQRARAGYAGAGYAIAEAVSGAQVGAARGRSVLANPLLRLQPVERMKFVEKLRSIHLNPEQRGLVTRPEDWRWSSFRHYATWETGVVEIEWQSTARGREQLGIFPTVRMPSAEEHPRPSGSLDGAPSRVKLKTIVRATRRADFSIRIET